MKVIIVGGGIAGLTVALELEKYDYDIVIIEKNLLGAGATRAAGGMLAPQAEGLKGLFLDLCLKAREYYKDYVKEIEEKTDIDVGYDECGIIVPAFSKDEAIILNKRIDSYKSQNLKASWLSREDIVNMGYAISDKVIGAAYYPDDAQVDNRLLTNALINLVRKSEKIKILEKTEVTGIIEKNNLFKSVKLKNGEEIEADICVLSAGAWSGTIFAIPIIPVKGEMISIKDKSLKNIFYSSKAYIIPRKNYDLTLIGATEEKVAFKEGNTVFGIYKLLTGLLETFPHFNKRFFDMWYGFRPDTPDHFPIIGKSHIKNLYFATGYHRNGILLAPYIAKILSDLIHKEEENIYIKAYDIFRFLKHIPSF